MPRVISPESAEAVELARFEQPNYRPQDHPYPKMLYKARRTSDGTMGVHDVNNEQFANSCQKIVMNESDEAVARGQGWAVTAKEAMARYAKDEDGVSEIAAVRAYEDRNMSDAAKAEAKAVEDASSSHVAEVPEAPRVKRAYRRKIVAAN